MLAEAEIISGFAMAGVKGRSCENREEALAAFAEATSGKHAYRVLILGQDVSDLISEEVIAWQLKGDYPLIVEVPPLSGERQGRKSLVESIRSAIGIQV